MPQILLNNELSATQMAAALRRATMIKVFMDNPDLSRADAAARVRKMCGTSIDSQLQAHLKYGVQAEMGLTVTKRCKHTMPKAVFTSAEKEAIQTKLDLHAVFLNGNPVLDELGRMVALSADTQVKATEPKKAKKDKKRASTPKAPSSELKTFMSTADEFSSDLRNRILTQGTDILKAYVELNESKVTQKELATMPIVDLLTVFINAANAHTGYAAGFKEAKEAADKREATLTAHREEQRAWLAELKGQNEELIQANSAFYKSVSNGEGTCKHDFPGQLADIHDGESCNICGSSTFTTEDIKRARSQGAAQCMEHLIVAMSSVDELTIGSMVFEALANHWELRD